jgi:hypothetical protein
MRPSLYLFLLAACFVAIAAVTVLLSFGLGGRRRRLALRRPLLRAQPELAQRARRRQLQRLRLRRCLRLAQSHPCSRLGELFGAGRRVREVWARVEHCHGGRARCRRGVGS